MENRYRLAEPVNTEFGSCWWEVSDMQQDFAVVSVFSKIPHAEEIARFAFSKLTESEMRMAHEGATAEESG